MEREIVPEPPEDERRPAGLPLAPVEAALEAQAGLANGEAEPGAWRGWWPRLRHWR